MPLTHKTYATVSIGNLSVILVIREYSSCTGAAGGILAEIFRY
jgi:hypothetical protein